MKITPQCVPCLLNRVVYESRLCTDDEATAMRALRASVEYLAGALEPGLAAVSVSTGVHRAAFSVLGDVDAYSEKKRFSNRTAEQMLPRVRELVASGADDLARFRNAVLASVVANSFDFGLPSHRVEERDFWSYFLTEYRRGLQVDHTPGIWDLARGSVLYLCDNCGEIYFDAMVMQLLRPRTARLVAVVRGGPILSDALAEDAEAAGVTEVADELLTTGSNAIGVKEDEAPAGLLAALRESDLVISKGMANYETMSELGGLAPRAYLLRAKCDPVADSLGVRRDDNVAMLVEG